MKRANLSLFLIVFLLLPLVQVGGNSFLSVSFLSITFLAICGLTQNGLLRALRFLPALFFAFALPYFDGVDSERFMSMVARSMRELVVFIFLIAIYFKRREVFPLSWRLKIWLPRLLYFFVAVAVIQLVAIALGFAPLVFLPWELFGSIAGDADAEKRVTTVASYWLEHAAEHDLSVGEDVKVRPSAFYAEPSYFGFVLFSLYVAYSKLSVSARSQARFFLVACVGMLVSRTLSGLLILLSYYAVSNFSRFARNPKAVALFVVSVALFVTLGEGGRLVLVVSSDQELSGYIRLIQPLVNIYTLLSDGMVFGVHPLMAPDYFNVSKAGFELLGFDNAFLNLFQFHGLGAVIIIVIVLRVFPLLDVFYLLLVCFFNGTLFGFDKGFVIGCILFLSAYRVVGGEVRAEDLKFGAKRL